MFATPVNRHLAQGSLTFYENLQESGVQLDLLRLGYLWLRTAAQMAGYGPTLKAMADAGVAFETLEPQELARRLPDLQVGDIFRGILGKRCGILNPNRLAGFYAREVTRLGGQFQVGVEVTGFVRDHQGLIRGVKVGDREILAGQILVATGPWLAVTLALAGLTVPVVAVKRQLFALKAQAGPLNRLLHSRGFNAHGLLPFTILPGEAYLRPAPAANAFIVGFANEDQPPGLEDRPVAEPEFFEARILPQLERYLPIFRGAIPGQSWAGLYEDHPPDRIAFVDQYVRRPGGGRRQRQRHHEGRFPGPGRGRALFWPVPGGAGGWETLKRGGPRPSGPDLAPRGIRHLTLRSASGLINFSPESIRRGGSA